MLPPPAPISISSIVEMLTGRPLPSAKRFARLASNSYTMSGSPSSTMASLAVVPAHVEREHVVHPGAAAEQRARERAGRGPDSSSWIGTRFASATWVSPPFESIMKSGALMPSVPISAASRSR